MEEFITACPRNCYSTCTFRVITDGNRVKKILPFESNRATPEGPCIKGLSYLEREFSDSRIKVPLRRNTDGTFSETGWDDVIEIISDRLQETRDTYGPHSILFYKGSGLSGLSNDISGYFWKLFGGATTTYGNLCWPAGLEAVRLTLGEVKHNAPWDLAHSDLIIFWGKNPAETNVQEMIHTARAREAGARVIVIDPRRTPTADKADIHLRPRPGTDALLALAVSRLLIEKGVVDTGFVKKHVLGYDKLKASLTITPSEAALETGIPADEIVRLADIIAASVKMTIVPGYGLQRYTNGGQTIRAIMTLVILRGMIGKSGCGFNYANLQGYLFDDPLEPLSYYPDSVRDIPFRREISMAKFGADFYKLNDPGIKAAWIERGNPVIQLPGSNEVSEALRSVPFKVVVEQFMTDTALMADIILPAKGIFEQADVVSSYWHPYVQYRPKLLNPPEGVKPESEIYWLLAGKMKLDAEGIIPDPADYDAWLRARVETVKFDLPSSIYEGPVIPRSTEEIAYAGLTFKTASGKIELWSDEAVRLWGVDPLPAYVPLVKSADDNLPFRLMTPNIGSRIHSQFGNLGVIQTVTEQPAWEMSPGDAGSMGIHNGDKIRVWNSRGEVEGIVRITRRVKNGSLVFPNGIWLKEGGGVNRLIEPLETDMGYGAAFHNTKAGVEKL